MMPSDVEIRELRVSDSSELAHAYRRNREHLAPWDPERPPSFFTAAGQAELVTQQVADSERGQSCGWVLIHGDRIIGRVNLNTIVRGAFCSAVLGYWVDLEQLGRGLATGMVDFACDQARQAGLHRVEASTLVHNVASQAVLARARFAPYGFAPEYLKIAGRWQDCRLFQRILHPH
jgi:ribosomal-protein-alanine N-acetyltransferase